MPDRRVPHQQVARVDGRRDSDPTLTTSDCARHLGVSTKFIVGEIRDGRLRALVITRPRRRCMYRVSPAALKAYLLQFRWTTPTPLATNS